MGTATEPQGPRPGLRERKKARTRAALREHALRLIREQGYASTTVEQIAAAAEVSPSTFFRYFRTKEDAVLYDPYDPLLIEAFRAQPDGPTPLEAVRRAMSAVFAALPPAELAGLRELVVLAYGVAELRVRMLDELVRSAQLTAQLVAERTGRQADDLAVQTFAGAIVGAMMAAATTVVADPQADVIETFDTALRLLGEGLPL